MFDPYLPIHYASTMTIKRCSKGSIPIVKQFLVENFQSPVKDGPQNGANSGKWGSKYGGLNVGIYVRDPKKAHSCAKTRVLAYFVSKSIQQPWL